MLRSATFAAAVSLLLAAFGGLPPESATGGRLFAEEASAVPSSVPIRPAPGSPGTERGRLPITKVILYKHGVGYFERAGTVSGDATVSLRFKGRDMSDLLKSLTVLDLDGGVIRAIAYESTKTVDQQLGEYTFDLRSAEGLPAILEQMKGSEVALRVAGNDVRGRVLSVEKRTEHKDNAEIESYILSILAEGGLVKSYGLTEMDELRFSDPKLQQEMQNYLKTLFSRLRREDKEVVIQASGKGDRRVLVAYVQEQPVWKVSYRIVLAQKEKPLLQAWAIVDNVSDEDWQNVSLSLVSGLPVSFVQDLYDPWYVRRPTIQVQREKAAGPVMYERGEEEVAAAAPTAAKAMAEVKVQLGDKVEMRRLPAAPGAAPMGGGGGFGFGGNASVNMLEELARQATSVVAQTAGALFVYNIQEPVTVLRDRSALLPIANARVEATRVSIYNEATRAENPMQGIRLKNTSDLTLEGGAVTVIEDDTYSGEALMDTLKADEQRYLSYAVDLGTRVNSKRDTGSQKIYHIRMNRGTLFMDYKQQEWKTYQLVNVEPKEKTVVVEHPFRRGWKLVDTAKPIEATPEHYRFEVKLPALSYGEGPAREVKEGKAEFKVTEESLGQSMVEITNIDSDRIVYYVQKKYIDQKTRDFLEKVVAMKAEIAGLKTQLDDTERKRTTVLTDQEHMRLNLQTLRDSELERDLRNTYVKQFAEEEKQLGDLGARMDQLRGTIEKEQKELDGLISGFTFETEL